MAVVPKEAVADEGEAVGSLGQVAEDEEHKVTDCMYMIFAAVEAGSAEVGWRWEEV